MSRRRTPKWLEAARVRDASSGDWLSRGLSRAGVFPFGVVEEAIRAGRCRVDGEVVTDPFAPVDATRGVLVDGVAVSLDAPTLVLMFHKPVGLVTAAQDREGAGTVFGALQSLLPPALLTYGWQAVGRLDRATSGLLLFANDERFVEHVTAPATHLPKTYIASTDGPIGDLQVGALIAGVALEDGPARALTARRRSPQEIEIIIAEGRHHQVRRMLNAVRLGIRTLHREAVGHLMLDVPVGTMRQLTESEIRESLSYADSR